MSEVSSSNHQLVRELRHYQTQVLNSPELCERAADEIERLHADVTYYKAAHASASLAVEELRKMVVTAPETASPHPYLCEGTRFKLSFYEGGETFTFAGYEEELNGKWVALVQADDNKHMDGYSQLQKTPEAIRRMAEGTQAMRDPVLGKAIAEAGYIDGAVQKKRCPSCDTDNPNHFSWCELPAEKAEPPQGFEIQCEVCKLTAIMPYTDETRQQVSTEHADGWLLYPQRLCPKCQSGNGGGSLNDR